jgi:hypothetical protein
VKNHGRSEVIERETPISAPESEIIVPSEAAAQSAGFSPELCETIRVIRRDVIATLRQVPAFVSAAQKMASEGRLYRVLVSEERVHLLREGADGIVKPFLRDAHGQFVENVELMRVPPDLAGPIAAIAINAALAEISAKLDVVAKTVGNLAELIRVANLGALQGAIDALEIARQLVNADRRREQMFDAAGGLALSTYFPDPVHKMAILCIAAVGMFAIGPLFWTLPTAFLSGTAAAGGIALINAIGNLAGFAAPYAMGYLKDATGGFSAGLLVVAFFPFLSAILVLILGHNPALERSVAPEAAD